MALDTVEKDPNAAALVTTGEGKFYSNGVDLGFAASNPNRALELLDAMLKLFSRVLPMPTVAAIDGNAIGGGFMLALAHDPRYMRSDKGLLLMNEVNLKMPLVPGSIAIVRCRMIDHAFHSALVVGRRFNGNEAQEQRFIDAALPNSLETREAAFSKAKELALRKFDHDTYSLMKREMYKSTIHELVSGGLGMVPLHRVIGSKL